MDGWKTSFLFGWPILRGELLVLGSVDVSLFQPQVFFQVPAVRNFPGWLYAGIWVTVGMVDLSSQIFGFHWVVNGVGWDWLGFFKDKYLMKGIDVT